MHKKRLFQILLVGVLLDIMAGWIYTILLHNSLCIPFGEIPAVVLSAADSSMGEAAVCLGLVAGIYFLLFLFLFLAYQGRRAGSIGFVAILVLDLGIHIILTVYSLLYLVPVALDVLAVAGECTLSYGHLFRRKRRQKR